MASSGVNPMSLPAGGAWVSHTEYKDLLRQFFAEKPAEVDGVANASAVYWWRKLARWCTKIMEIENAPDNWDMSYFWMHLFLNGQIGITDTVMGVLPLKCTATGNNVFDKPTTMMFTNHVLGDFERAIDEDGVLVYIQYDYSGISDMLNRYSYFFAATDSAMAVNLLNTKTAWIAEAESAQQAESFKKLYDDIAMGKPLVVARKDVGKEPFNVAVMNIKNTFIVPELQAAERMFLNMFLTDIGIPNFNSDKQARLNTEEVHGNDVEVLFGVQDWEDNISAQLDKANAMFGLNLKLRVRSREEILKLIGGAQEATQEDDTAGTGGSDGEEE